MMTKLAFRNWRISVAVLFKHNQPIDLFGNENINKSKEDYYLLIRDTV
jgi:hypothetical protein